MKRIRRGRPDINTAGYRVLAAQTTDAWLAETLTGFCDEIDELRRRGARRRDAWLAWSLWLGWLVFATVAIGWLW